MKGHNPWREVGRDKTGRIAPCGRQLFGWKWAKALSRRHSTRNGLVRAVRPVFRLRAGPLRADAKQNWSQGCGTVMGAAQRRPRCLVTGARR